MGFNRRKMEDQRRTAAEKEAASRRATDAEVLEDAERLIAAWNERQAKRMPMLFSPTSDGNHADRLLKSAKPSAAKCQGWRPRSYNTTAATIKAAESMMRKIVERSMLLMTLPPRSGSDACDVPEARNLSEPARGSRNSRHLLKLCFARERSPA
jgi:hypothetical protein